MSLTKICALRESSHMLAAARAGADLLGMVFVPGVRRAIPPETARQMVAAFRVHYPPSSANPWEVGAGRPLLVGLFADQPVDEVANLAAEVGLDRVQLCGNEDADYRSRVPLPLVQVLRVPNLSQSDPAHRRNLLASLEDQLAALEDEGHLAILDSAGPGGSGNTFDWSLARELADRGRRFLLAGGLTPDNVAEAVAVAHPWGVDVSSGVETQGVKDVTKIRAFLQAAHRALSVMPLANAGTPSHG